jgi:hypothetical protein
MVRPTITPRHQRDVALQAAQAAFPMLNPAWWILGVVPRRPLPHARVRRWECYRVLGHRIRNGLDDENSGTKPPAAAPSRTVPAAHSSAPGSPQPKRIPGRAGRRVATGSGATSPPATVSTSPAHPLDGQERAYCPIHAAEASQAPGAVLLHRRPTPPQLTLPGIQEPAGP